MRLQNSEGRRTSVRHLINWRYGREGVVSYKNYEKVARKVGIQFGSQLESFRMDASELLVAKKSSKIRTEILAVW